MSSVLFRFILYLLGGRKKDGSLHTLSVGLVKICLMWENKLAAWNGTTTSKKYVALHSPRGTTDACEMMAGPQLDNVGYMVRDYI